MKPAAQRPPGVPGVQPGRVHRSHAPLARWVAAGALLCPALALAHADLPGQADGATPAWVLACLALSIGLYAVGWWRLHARAAASRRTWLARGACFAAGWAVLALALLSPLDALGARQFSAHMLQHALLMVVAAPLLVAGTPLGVWAWALSLRLRRGVGALLHRPVWRGAWRWLCRPTVAWALHGVALWAWHAPVLFDAALHDDGWHTLQHASFLLTALLYWWTVLGARQRAAQGQAVLSLFATMMHSGALGALLALSPTVWYPAYAAIGASGGFTPLEDQQLGGLLMWMPAGIVYMGVGLALALRWGGLGAAQDTAQDAAATPRPGGSAGAAAP